MSLRGISVSSDDTIEDPGGGGEGGLWGPTLLHVLIRRVSGAGKGRLCILSLAVQVLTES